MKPVLTTAHSPCLLAKASRIPEAYLQGNGEQSFPITGISSRRTTTVPTPSRPCRWFNLIPNALVAIMSSPTITLIAAPAAISEALSAPRDPSQSRSLLTTNMTLGCKWSPSAFSSQSRSLLCVTVTLILPQLIALASTIYRVVYRRRKRQLWWDDNFVVVALAADILYYYLLWVRISSKGRGNSTYNEK